MKTQTTFRLLLTALFAAAMFTACNKEGAELKLEMDLPLDEISLVTVEELVIEANERYLGVEVEVDPNNSMFRLANDGLIDEYTADDRGFGTVRPPHNRFLACIRSVEPDADQRPLIARSLQQYRMRNERIIRAHRQRVHELHQRMDGARRQLHQRFMDGEIDRDQFRRQAMHLRERYQEALNQIRASHAEAFSQSYAILLEQLQEILTEEQWEAFAACLLED